MTDTGLEALPCFLSHIMGELSTLFSPLYSPGPFPKQKDIILDSRFVYVAHRSQALRRLQNKPFIC